MRAGLALLLLLAAPAAVAADAPQPYELVRRLRFADDRMAAGDATAFAERERMLREASSALASAPKEAWADGRNARALLVWTLASGDPGLLARLVEAGRLDAARPLAELVLAVVKGDRAKAERSFDAVDVHALEPTLVAALALATIDRLGPDLPARAQGLLERTTARMPGTFFAEAAQRRLIAAHFQRGADAPAQQLMAGYRLRFPASLLAGRLIEHLVHVAGEAGPEGDVRLVRLLVGVPAGARTPTASELLDVARGPLLAGRLPLGEALAGLSAGRAVSEAEKVRARLYLAAAVAPQGRGQDVPGAAEVAALDAFDRALHAGVLAMAGRSGAMRGQAAAGARTSPADVVARGRAVSQRAAETVEQKPRPGGSGAR